MSTWYVEKGGSDSNAGTAQGAGNAWLTVSHGVATMAGGDTLYVKYSATVYGNTATMTPPAGTVAAPTQILGYFSTPGDNGFSAGTWSWPTIQTTSGSFTQFTVSAAYCVIGNFILDGNSVSASRGIGTLTTASDHFFFNVWVKNCLSNGFQINTPASLANCRASNCTLSGFSLTANATVNCCLADANPAPGFLSSGGTRILLLSCASRGNTSANHGYSLANTSECVLQKCVAYGNAGDGINYSGATFRPIIQNCDLVDNTGYGINFTGANMSAPASPYQIDFNAFFGNGTAARSADTPVGPNDVILTGDPFVAAASNNFALIGSGAGSQLRGTGWPGALWWGSTGFTDLAPFPHADTTTSAGQSRYRSGGY